VVGARLDKARERGISALHDRRIPGTRANIDHIAVGPRGVFVIDAKKYTGGPSLRVEGGLFSPRGDFTIGGIEVLWPKKAISRVTSPGALGPAEIDAVARSLASHFPQA
jgi:hypothetical protein